MNEARVSRRLLLSAGFSAATAAVARTVCGQTTQGEQVSFKDELEKGLRARLPREFEFIARVVDMVDKKQLPRELVESTFQWARRKPRYPFPYFERGLRDRAAKLGITI
jgi:hypothetical protein